MRTVLLSVAAACAVAAAAPASAQYQYGAQPNYAGEEGFANRIDQLEERLEDGIDNGWIDRTEARSIRYQIRQLTRIEQQYAANGLTRLERQELQRRIREVRHQLRAAEGRYAGADEDYDDDYDRVASYPQVNQVCSTPSALGSIFGRIFGADNCLRVGERLTGNLNALPAEYRDQFRNDSDRYYGYWSGYVVQVDPRTTVVTRIYDVPA